MSEAPSEIGPVELLDDQPEPPYGSGGVEKASRSTLRKVVLGVLLLAGVVAVGTLAWAGWLIGSQKDARLTMPTQIGGLRLDDSEDGKSTADYLQTALAAEVDLDNVVGAVYSDGGGKNILVFGGTTLFLKPGSDLDTAFTLISDNAGAVTNLHEVPAGRLGGTMKCGTTKSEDGNLPVCGWADHGSLALAMFPSRTEAEAPPLMRQIRDAIESR